jgi:hypothetical protein
VLVVMMVCSLLFGAMLRTGREEHRFLRAQQSRVQAMELAQAGLERAAARLAADSAYQSEVWQILPAELNGRQGAVVNIEIEAIDGRPQSRRIRVEVNYPPTGQQRVQHRRAALIDLSGKE